MRGGVAQQNMGRGCHPSFLIKVNSYNCMSQFGGKRDRRLTCRSNPEETALPVFGAATSKAATSRGKNLKVLPSCRGTAGYSASAPNMSDTSIMRPEQRWRVWTAGGRSSEELQHRAETGRGIKALLRLAVNQQWKPLQAIKLGRFTMSFPENVAHQEQRY